MEEKKRIGKTDLIVIGIAAVVLAAACLFFYMSHRQQGQRVRVTVDGKLYGEYSLDEEQTVAIGKTNTLIIKEQKADMIWADCPDLLCVHQRAIFRDGENIVCLPNRVVVTVIGDKDPQYDAIVQ